MIHILVRSLFGLAYGFFMTGLGYPIHTGPFWIGFAILIFYGMYCGLSENK